MLTHHRDNSAITTARARGFTLIETALATIIVGTGVLAIMSAQQAFFKQYGAAIGQRDS